MEQQAVANSKNDMPTVRLAVCEGWQAGRWSSALRCGSCGKTQSENKEQENVFGTKQAVDDTKTLLALRLLVEGNSIRSTERITGIHGTRL